MFTLFTLEHSLNGQTVAKQHQVADRQVCLWQQVHPYQSQGTMWCEGCALLFLLGMVCYWLSRRRAVQTISGNIIGTEPGGDTGLRTVIIQIAN